MKNDLNEFPLDSFITNDEWDFLRAKIEGEIIHCNRKGVDLRRLPFTDWFEKETKNKLLKAGFRKEIIEDEKKLKKLIHIITWEQGEDVNLPYGFPSGTYKVSKDKKTVRINPDIEACLLVLESIKIMKELLITDGEVNKEAVKIYLRSLELIINLSRAGNIAALAVSEVAKKENSRDTHELKKIIIRRAIIYIFDTYPKNPKTAGGVWNKLNTIKKSMTDKKTGKKYQIKTGMNKTGEDIILITGDELKKPLLYKRRTLERLVKEIRNLK